MSNIADEFAGKVILVTGAARGQGAEHVKRFAGYGATVIATDVAAEEGQALAESLGENVTFLQHDVGSDADWATVADHIKDAHGKLDILVNNAGIYKPQSIAETESEAFMLTVRINQLGPFLGMRACADLLGASGEGSIINISSAAGLVGFEGAIAYVGTKWALRGMTKVAAKELAPQKIRVNSVHPGFVDTGMLDANPAEVNEWGRDVTPLKRLGTTEDITNLVEFLASPRSSYVTGAEVAVDGGFIL